jgi:tRNA nucleotidyltransferase/poly(A) polymerase
VERKSYNRISDKENKMQLENSQLKKNYDAVRAVLVDGELAAVGGCTRDTLLGVSVKDWDYATSLTPDEMEVLIRKAGRRVYETGRRWGTLGFKVLVDGKYELVECTTYRTDCYDGKSRKPEVTFAKTLKEDVSRRDSTINSIAYDGEKLIDFFGGRLDLHAGLLKSVGPAKECIMDDPLRIMRFARFAARFGYQIDANFIGKARQLADRIFDVSKERWTQEFDKLLTYEHAGLGLKYLHDMGILQRVLPELYYADCDGRLTLEDLPDKFDKDPDIAWKMLLDLIPIEFDCIKEPTRTRKYVQSGVISRLKMSNGRAEIILGKKC